MTKIFVYGTLREGHGNHRLIEHSEKLGEATAPGNRTGPISVTPPNNGETVRGEVYRIDEDTLENVDRLEGYRPSVPDDEQRGYVRTPVEATFDDGSTTEAEIYYVGTNR